MALEDDEGDVLVQQSHSHPERHCHFLMDHDDHVVVVVVMVCVNDVQHFGEVALDAHWDCSREDHVVVQREEEVVHGHRALDHLDVLVEVHDVHDVLVSTLRSFLYGLSVKKLVVAQGC